jgi:hypothetical protein
MEESVKQDTRAPAPTSFQRFTDFAKRLFSVPKTEIDERAREYDRQKQARRQKRRRGIT